MQNENFDTAASVTGGCVKAALLSLDEKIKAQTAEIRLKKGKEIVLWGRYGAGYLSCDGTLSKDRDGAVVCSGEALDDCFSRACRFSVHSHIESLVGGFVTIGGGHRVGVCGTAVVGEKGQICSLRNVSSLNIRIAREKKGSADELYRRIFASLQNESVIIAGAPMSGKTTLLRDLVRKLSDEGMKKVCLVDARQEIAAMRDGESCMDVGVNTDVYDLYPKAEAVMNAVRTMSPHFIAMDELCSDSEISSIRHGINSGVLFIVTVHASSYAEILKRPQIERLLGEYSFNKLVLLKNGSKPGEIEGIYETKEIRDEIFRTRACVADADLCGVCSLIAP